MPRFGRPPAPCPAPLVTRATRVGLAHRRVLLLTQLHVNLGLVLLGLVASFEQAGIYNSAYRLVFFLMTLDRVFYTVYFPVVSRFIRAPARPPGRTRRALRLRMILVLSLPLCVGAIILAGPVLELVFSAEYLPAVPVLRILVWFLPLSMLNSLAGYTLLGAGKERRFLRNTVIGVGVSVVLNLVAVPLAPHDRRRPRDCGGRGDPAPLMAPTCSRWSGRGWRLQDAGAGGRGRGHGDCRLPAARTSCVAVPSVRVLSVYV